MTSDGETTEAKVVLPPFQIRNFGFFRYIAFAMYLDIHYVWIHSKNNIAKKAKTSYNLEWRE
jgi:hypothetical protein